MHLHSAFCFICAKKVQNNSVLLHQYAAIMTTMTDDRAKIIGTIIAKFILNGLNGLLLRFPWRKHDNPTRYPEVDE